VTRRLPLRRAVAALASTLAVAALLAPPRPAEAQEIVDVRVGVVTSEDFAGGSRSGRAPARCVELSGRKFRFSIAPAPTATCSTG
jgi:hypothetical protein